MEKRTTPAIDSRVNSLDLKVSTARLLGHLRKTKDKKWSMESYKWGGGPEEIPKRRFKYLLNEAYHPTLYREEFLFLVNLSGIPPAEIFGLPAIESLGYDEAAKGLDAMVGEGRVEELKKRPDVKDSDRWVKAEYLLNLTTRCLNKYPSKN